MKKLIISVSLCVCCAVATAQHTAGLSGLLDVPSADFNPDGTFSTGINYLPRSITPEIFSYSTGNFFASLTFLPFLEVSYRATLLRMSRTGNKMSNQDRSVTLKIRLLRESSLIPAVVIGSDDILTQKFLTIFKDDDHGNQYFGKIYVAATKNISLSGHRLGLTLGYTRGRTEKYRGLTGGLRYNPPGCRTLSLITEFDTVNVNTGLSVTLFKHIYIQAFSTNLNSLSAGIAYVIQL